MDQEQFFKPGDKVKPKNYKPPIDGSYPNPIPVGWRLVAFSEEGQAIVQITLIAYGTYEVEDLEPGGKG